MRLAQMERFLEMSKAPGADREVAFVEAFGTIEEEIFQFMKFVGLFKLDASLEVLERNTRKLQELGVESLIDDVLAELERKHSVTAPVEAQVFVLDEDDTYCREKMGGVSGFCAGDGSITFILYPEENVLNTLRSTAIHEYHHHWRASLVPDELKGETLLHRVVNEGLAEHFVAQELGVKRCGPWIHALSDEQAREMLPAYIEHKDCIKGVRGYLFGAPNKGIPTWAGYSMGYHLVKWYREKHPEETIAELTQLPRQAFLP